MTLFDFIDQPVSTGVGFPDDHVVLDVEATGFDPRRAFIVDLAAYRFVDGKLVEQIDTLIGIPPKVRISNSHVHGITAADLVEAPPIWDVAPHLLRLLSGTSAVVGHSVGFDLRHISTGIGRGRNPRRLPDLPTYDTMEMARQVWRSAKGHRLEDCCQRIGVDTTGAHRAGVDVSNTELLFQYLCGQMGPAVRTMGHRSTHDRITPARSA